MVSPESTQAVEASPRVHELLHRLHALSTAQESSLSQGLWYISRLASYYLLGKNWLASYNARMLDKFVSLDQDKCQLTYLLARSIGARNIVEAGTSFGVSTIYLALAVGQNVGPGGKGKVIATEKEPVKAERAQKYWEEAGEEVEPWIEMRVGDLLETLKDEEGMPDEIDMLLLDIWTPLALPTLEIIRPRLRKGALVLVDNTTWGKPMYKSLLDYLHDPKNNFKTATAPYGGGYEVAVYLPS
ncbi:hypothetical protein ACO1O0_001639 [Amphichorda felina]